MESIDFFSYLLPGATVTQSVCDVRDEHGGITYAVAIDVAVSAAQREVRVHACVGFATLVEAIANLDAVRPAIVSRAWKSPESFLEEAP